MEDALPAEGFTFAPTFVIPDCEVEVGFGVACRPEADPGLGAACNPDFDPAAGNPARELPGAGAAGSGLPGTEGFGGVTGFAAPAAGRALAVAPPADAVGRVAAPGATGFAPLADEFGFGDGAP